MLSSRAPEVLKYSVYCGLLNYFIVSELKHVLLFKFILSQHFFKHLHACPVSLSALPAPPPLPNLHASLFSILSHDFTHELHTQDPHFALQPLFPFPTVASDLALHSFAPHGEQWVGIANPTCSIKKFWFHNYFSLHSQACSSPIFSLSISGVTVPPLAMKLKVFLKYSFFLARPHSVRRQILSVLLQIMVTSFTASTVIT